MRSMLQIARAWRSAEIRLLVYALVIAVMAVTSVSFFTDRIDRAMRAQAVALFGADLIIRSTRPIDQQYDEQAKALGLTTARTIEFPSVVVAGDESALVQVHAISAAYPLRGSLETSSSPDKPGSPTSEPIAADEVWVEAGILYRLKIAVGAPIQVGEKVFTVSRIITAAAQGGGSAFQLAPGLYLPLQQLPDTGLLSPASRANYRWLAAGDSDRIARLQQQVEEELKPSETLQTARDGRPEINSALERATRFMSLATILTVILAGAAIALASASYTRREQTQIAVMKSIGFTRRQLRFRYVQTFALIILTATVVGGLLGYFSHLLLARILADWVAVDLPAAGLRPLFTGAFTAVLTLTGFTWPALTRLLATPPVRILRSEGAGITLSVPVILAFSGAATWIFLVWQAKEFKLASIIFVAIVLSIAVFFFIARLVAKWSRLIPLKTGESWRLGIRNTGRYQKRSSMLIATFGITILTLLMLSSVRHDLMKAWQASIPVDAPNHFLVNIQRDDLSALDQFLARRGSGDVQFYPMIRGRLVAINDQPVSEANYDEARARRLVSREFNLSATDVLPADNKIISGDWAQALSAGELSVEQGIAETLGFKFGDELTFDIAGQRITRKIGNVREVNWDSMQPNFFVILPPDLARSLPATYITSLYISDQDQRFTADLVKAFPTITSFDVRMILQQVRRIINQASMAVQYVFAFTLLAGIIVLLAAIQTQRHERSQEIAVLKTLGARQSQIKWSVAAEFAYIGLLAGIIGGVLALGLGWILATHVFNLNYSANIFWPVVSVIITSALVMMTGMAGVRPLLRSRPVVLLRQG